CGVDRRGQSGRSAAHDHQVVAGPLGGQPEAELGGELIVARLDQVGTVRESDRGDGTATVLQPLDVGQTVRIEVDIHPFVWHPVFGEKLLGPLAVWAPWGAVHHDVIHGQQRTGYGTGGGFSRVG